MKQGGYRHSLPLVSLVVSAYVETQPLNWLPVLSVIHTEDTIHIYGARRSVCFIYWKDAVSLTFALVAIDSLLAV